MHHEFKRVTLTLLYDKWKHANQRPWVNSAGVVSAKDSCAGITGDGDGIDLINLTAYAVGWLQPWQSLGSLGSDPKSLFPTNVWDDAWIKLAGVNGDGYSVVTPDTCDGA